ncbi:MAG: hypothetical protein ACOYD4_06105 [Solirubrobacterales bacterium]
MQEVPSIAVRPPLAPRLRRAILAGLLAALLPLLTARPAGALSGDPAIVNLAPETLRSMPVTDGGFTAVYSCPAYRTGSAAAGEASQYGVRFARGNAGSDGRLPGPGSAEFLGEAPAQAIPGTGNCASQLRLPNSPTPAALYFGGVSWQAFRNCPGCDRGWEAGPVSWAILIPSIEDPRLTIPDRVYAGYLSRITFTSPTDLSGSEIALQWMSRRHDWADLGRTPYLPGVEPTFFVKLPAGHRLLRIVAFANPAAQLGLPYEEVTVQEPGRQRATGPADDGEYRAGGPGPVEFEVDRGGRRLIGFEATMLFSCGGAPPQENVLTSARLRGVRIAPDGGVVGRSRSPEGPTISTLEGRLRHGRFVGTAQVAFRDCAGTRTFVAHLRR